jgi:hypothetical protein
MEKIEVLSDIRRASHDVQDDNANDSADFAEGARPATA